MSYANILLCSASVDGRVYIWKITEGPGEEEKSQITGKIVMAIQIVGEGDSVHPRVCWHCHKQVHILLVRKGSCDSMIHMLQFIRDVQVVQF